MKKFALFIIATILAGNLVAQVTIDRDVVGSGGDFESLPGLQLSWTIGESCVAAYDVAGLSLYEGFQQELMEMIPCLGDFDFDGDRDTSDLLILLSEFSCSMSCTWDLSGDDAVNTEDLLILLSVFGTLCP